MRAHFARAARSSWMVAILRSKIANQESVTTWHPKKKFTEEFKHGRKDVFAIEFLELLWEKVKKLQNH
jgi:hypothetical protein